ncbi:DUF6476 family protein [Oceaniglobus roseus]|uniref:DUF6476 family protein n=1 Tax=Oceaniglobus roseus TaxID=1737570 RepID=UPI000C7EDB80|nr:DUF6476 family protein [Kandeliimicrobium roseum]
MEDTPLDPEQARTLRFLRWLVTGLTTTMIAGLIVLIALFVTRFPDNAALPLPDSIALPEGTKPFAVTRGRGWLAVVTEDDRILIFDAASGELRQTVRITVAP